MEEQGLLFLRKMCAHHYSCTDNHLEGIVEGNMKTILKQDNSFKN